MSAAISSLLDNASMLCSSSASCCKSKTADLQQVSPGSLDMLMHTCRAHVMG